MVTLLTCATIGLIGCISLVKLTSDKEKQQELNKSLRDFSRCTASDDAYQATELLQKTIQTTKELNNDKRKCTKCGNWLKGYQRGFEPECKCSFQYETWNNTSFSYRTMFE